jgi:hypothetical protein
MRTGGVGKYGLGCRGGCDAGTSGEAAALSKKPSDVERGEDAIAARPSSSENGAVR